VTILNRLFKYFELVWFLSIPSQAGWLRLNTARFELYSNAGESRARAALLQLDTARVVLAQAGLPLPDSVPPIRVVLFDKTSEFERFRRSGTTAAFFQSGAERDYIVLGPVSSTDRALRHEFVHLILHHTTAPLPRWLEEGLAEFFSTLEVAGGKALIGRAIPTHVALLRQQGWMPPQEFLSTGREAPWEDDPRLVALFYSQSWAVVHTLQQSPDFRGRTPHFVALLAAGQSQEAAFQGAFGASAQEVLDAALKSVGTGRIAVAEIRLADSAPQAPSSVAGVADLEAGLVQADLALACRKLAEAERLYTQLLRQAPESPEAASGLGLLALRRGDVDAAERLLRRAVAQKSAQASTYFELALLLRDYRRDEAGALANLRTAIQLNPGHAEAQFLLGRALFRAGRPAEAVEPLERAASLLPRQSQFWLELAEVRQALGQAEAAQADALRGVEAAATPQESEMARGLLRVLESPVALPRRKSEVITPKSWESPRGDATVEGQLVQVECVGDTLKFHVATGGRRVILHAPDPGRVVLSGGSAASREFACGAQKGEPRVRVEYKTSGEIVSIEFR
jgi:tetratricopeptide (TPR) repeat protein